MAETKIYVGKEGAQELYRRLKVEIGKITAFVVAEPDEEGHPDVQDPSTHVIYLVKDTTAVGKDKYYEWIWSEPEGEEGEWVCIGDTTINLEKYVSVEQQTFTSSQQAQARSNIGAAQGIVYKEIEGTVEGTTMTVEIGDNEYCKFDVPDTIVDLVIRFTGVAVTGSVTTSHFQFALSENTVLEEVYVVDADDEPLRSINPMDWPGQVVYQGNEMNGIVTIFGYSEDLPGGPRLITDQGKSLITETGHHLVYEIKD